MALADYRHPGFGRLFHDGDSTMDNPAHTAHEIEQYQDRIEQLQAVYIAAGDALTAIYMASGFRPDPEDDPLTTSVIRDSVLEQIEDLYARIEELRVANALHATAAECLSAENAGLREDRERLDWVEAHGQGEIYRVGDSHWFIRHVGGQHETFRQAVDAARGVK
jgi:hypothetical protein